MYEYIYIYIYNIYIYTYTNHDQKDEENVHSTIIPSQCNIFPSIALYIKLHHIHRKHKMYVLVCFASSLCK